MNRYMIFDLALPYAEEVIDQDMAQLERYLRLYDDEVEIYSGTLCYREDLSETPEVLNIQVFGDLNNRIDPMTKKEDFFVFDDILILNRIKPFHYKCQLYSLIDGLTDTATIYWDWSLKIWVISYDPNPISNDCHDNLYLQFLAPFRFDNRKN